MRTLALLGGMTPDVTALYYKIINDCVRRKLGARHSARMYIFSVDLESQLRYVEAGDMASFANEFTQALRPLTSKQIDGHTPVHGVLLGAILAHKVASQIRDTLPPHIEFLHVADMVALSLKARGISKVGLIGPKLTMIDSSPDFFIGKLTCDHHIEVLVPDTEEEIEAVNHGMMSEVVKGSSAVTPQTRQMFRDAAIRLIDRGVQGLILGSTDLGFVLSQADFDVPVVDAAYVHAEGVAEWALSTAVEDIELHRKSQ